jgi:hypothetical protein
LRECEIESAREAEMENPNRLYDVERTCEECPERFWGSPRQACCSAACYSRRYRARKAKARIVDLRDLCTEIVQRGERGSASWSKLLPRLFRQTAVELRKLGWDPFELLMSVPHEPASDQDMAPGGISGVTPGRRRWRHPPDVEIDLLTLLIARRRSNGRSVDWHLRRIAALKQIIEAEP